MKHWLTHWLSVCVAVAVMAGAAVECGADDWSEWRGPHKDGTLRECPPLLDAIPEGKLRKVWEVEIPGYTDGGLSSPVACGGLVYVHVSWLKHQPVTTRRFEQGALGIAFGNLPAQDKVPAEVEDKIEAARLSDERNAQTSRELPAWIKAWREANLTPEQDKELGNHALDRLRRGRETITPSSWRKVAAAANQTFPSQEAFGQWLEEQGIQGDDYELLMKAVPTTTPYRDEVLMCLNAADGSVAWERTYSSVRNDFGESSTPCVADGKVFFIGASGAVYCLNAATSEEVWVAPNVITGALCHSSPTVVEGRMIVHSTRELVALDAATGAPVWRKEGLSCDSGSPALWQHEGKTYIIACGNKELACLDPADGNTLWTIPGSKWTTPAVNGDIMGLMIAEVALAVYQLSLTGAEELGRVPLTFRSCSPVVAGARVYALSSKKGLCFDAATRTVLWETEGTSDIYSSPILADGKLIASNAGSVLLYDAATGKRLARGSATFAECTSSGLVDGMLLARGKAGLVSYDLRKNPEP